MISRHEAILETVLNGTALAVSVALLILTGVMRAFHVGRVRRGDPPLVPVDLGLHLFSAALVIAAGDLLIFLFRSPYIDVRLLWKETPEGLWGLPESTLALVRLLGLSVLVYQMFRYSLRHQLHSEGEHPHAVHQALEGIHRIHRTNMACWLFVFFCHLLFYNETLHAILVFLDNPNLYLLWEAAILLLALLRLPHGDAHVRWRFPIVLMCRFFSDIVYETHWLSVLFHLAAVLFLLYMVCIYQLEQRLQLNTTRLALARERDVILEFLKEISEEPASGEGTGARPGEPATPDLDQFAVDRVLRFTLDFAVRQVSASAGCIFLVEPDSGDERSGGVLVPREVVGLYPPQTDISGMEYVAVKQRFLSDLVRNERIPVGQTIVGQVARDAHDVMLEGSAAATQFPNHNVDYLTVRSAMVLPLIAGGRVEGVLSLLQVGAEPSALPFTQTDLTVIRSLVDQAGRAIRNARVLADLREKERLERDIRLAQDVQRLLLPEHPPKLPGYAIEALCRSAFRVGGDYYDFVEMDAGRMAIVVADVSGKGVPGALTMAMVRSLLVAQATHCTTARDLLITVNDFLCRNLRKDMFVSMVLGVLDTTKRTLSICRAGHEPVLRIDGETGRSAEIAPDGIALGLDAGDVFCTSLKTETVDLRTGDLVLFYTDGLTEAQNARREEFGLGRLKTLLCNRRKQHVQDLRHLIDREVMEFTGNVPQHDDLTFVLLKVLEEAPVEVVGEERMAGMDRGEK